MMQKQMFVYESKVWPKERYIFSIHLGILKALAIWRWPLFQRLESQNDKISMMKKRQILKPLDFLLK